MPAAPILLLAEGPGDLILERADEVGHHGANPRLHEHLDRHARNQLDRRIEPREFARRNSDPNRIIGCSAALVLRHVGRHQDHLTVDLRRCAAVEVGKAHHCGLADAELVDVLRLRLSFDDQLVGRRDDQHDLLACRDHAADGVDIELVHHAVLRSADIDPLELVLGGNLLLDQFGDLAANLRKVLADLGAHVLLDLQSLNLRLGDLALGLRDRCDELSSLPLEPRLYAFQRRHPAELDELLGPQLTHAFELFLDPLDLLVLGADLRDQAGDFRLRLGYALTELRLQPFARLAPDLEQPGFAAEYAAHFRIVLPPSQFVRKVDLRPAFELGFFTRAPGGELIQPLGDDRQIGASLRVVELDHHVAGVDQVAVACPQFGDDAAGRVLHLLHIGIDDELALRDHRAGKFASRSPSAEAADQQQNDHQADQDMAPNRFRRVHDVVPPASPTRRNPPPPAAAAAGAAAGGAACCGANNLASTSSRGPSACERPLSIART